MGRGCSGMSRGSACALGIAVGGAFERYLHGWSIS